MKIFKINTHSAYLNYDVKIINCISDSTITISDSLSIFEYEIESSLILKLSAGTHKLSTTYNGDTQEETIVIKDAIKLGGSTIKKGYIFDNSPYRFVVMLDRMYIYNSESKEESLEYGLTPENISPLGNHYVLFRTSEDYSIYNLNTNKTILLFNKLIYKNQHSVIYEKDSSIFVYDYVNEKLVINTKGKYSINKKTDIFHFENNGHFCSINLLTNERNDSNRYRISTDTFQMYGEYALLLINIFSTELVRYLLLNLENAHTDWNYLPTHIITFFDKEMNENSTFKNELQDFITNNIETNKKHPYVIHSHYYYDVIEVTENEGTTSMKIKD